MNLLRFRLVLHRRLLSSRWILYHNLGLESGLNFRWQYNLCFDLKLSLTPEDIKVIANKAVNAWQEQISLDPEAHRVLHTLHCSKKLALVSNFDHPPHVHSVLSKLSLTSYFDSVVISAEVGIKKPDPRIFDSAFQQTGMKPKEVIYVGDTVDDTIAARAAGIVPILIQRDNEGNTLDFSVNKYNLGQEKFTPDVTTIAKLSELLTEFLLVHPSAALPDP